MRELLSLADDTPLFLLCSSTCITRRQFAERVFQLDSELSQLSVSPADDFYVVEDQEPVDYYAMLLAMWLRGRRSVMPNLDYVSGYPSFSFHAGSVSVVDDRVCLVENQAHSPVGFEHEGDTVCFSSGSTGKPKGILHRHSHFIANASSVAGRLGSTGFTSITPLKPYLVSGLAHFLVHWLLGARICYAPFDELHRFVDLVYREAPDAAFVGSPMHILSGLQYIPKTAKPRFFFSSGDFMYPTNIRRTLKRFPRTVFFNVYGLAELAGRFVINRLDAQSSDEALAYMGDPIDGISYAVEDNQLMISSPLLFEGYIHQGRFQPSRQPFPTGDLVESTSRGHRLVGRTGDELKIAGNKVSLKRIEGIVAGAFEDDQCVVFDLQHPSVGTVLAVAFKGAESYSRIDIIRRLKPILKPHEMPQVFFSVDEIPVTQSMKVDRSRMRSDVSTYRPIV